MEHLFVLKDVLLNKDNAGGVSLVTSMNAINTLLSGALSMFPENSEIPLTVANCAAQLADKKKLYLVMGKGDAILPNRISGLIDRKTANVTYSTYLAGTAQKSFVGYDGVDAATAMNFNAISAKYEEISVGIVDLSLPKSDILGRYNYSVTSVSATEAQTDIIGRLVTKINADVNRIVNATKIGAGTGIQLEQRSVGKAFKITVSGNIEAATVTYNNAQCVVASEGVGTTSKMIELENQISAYRGNMGIQNYSTAFFNAASEVDASTNYDLINITWQEEIGRTIGHNDFNQGRRSIIVAYPTGSATFLIASVKTIFAEAFGSTTADIETGNS